MQTVTARDSQVTWLTIAEVATHYSVSTRTIHRWIAEGMPRHKPGRLRFDVDETDAWVRSRCSTETPAQESAA